MNRKLKIVFRISETLFSTAKILITNAKEPKPGSFVLLFILIDLCG